MRLCGLLVSGGMVPLRMMLCCRVNIRGAIISCGKFFVHIQARLRCKDTFVTLGTRNRRAPPIHGVRDALSTTCSVVSVDSDLRRD